MRKKIGRQTYKFEKRICIRDTRSIAGPIESQGPLKSYFHETFEDDLLGQDSFEKAEHQMCLKNILSLLETNQLNETDIDIYIGGDLLNQIITTNLTARDLKIPYWGLYNACSTFVEAIQAAAVLLDGDFINRAVISTASHFSTAERQYRFPLELGTQSPPSAQRTVTGSGAMILEKSCLEGPFVTHMTIGKVMDFEQSDPNDMGSAMAIAACDTIMTHLEDLDVSVEDYDLIVTGDLGEVGYNITKDFLRKKGLNIENRYKDCGMLVYDIINQDVMCGGSGAGCSSTVFTSYFYNKLKNKELNKILLVATGALLSPVSTGQKENIPCIAHAVTIENSK